MARRTRAGTDAAPAVTARVAALRLLGRRDYSSAELTTRLTRRGYSDDQVRAAIDALTAEGAVDDRRAARAHVRAASRVKGRGPHRIRRELEARGIAAPLVDDALAEVSPEEDLESIRRLLARRRLPHPLPSDQRRRLFSHLMRRGFSPASIAAALRMDPPEE